MHPLNGTCCTASQVPPSATWLTVVGLFVIRIAIGAIWIRPNEDIPPDLRAAWEAKPQ